MAAIYGGGWINSSAYPADGDTGDAEEEGFLWSSSDAKIQTNSLTVELEPNDGGDPREGMIMAFPQGVWNKIKQAADENPSMPGDVMEILFDGSSVADEYTEYIVAYIWSRICWKNTGLRSEPVSKSCP